MYIYKYIKKFTTLINSKVKIFLLYFYVIFVALNFYYKVNKQIIMRKTITFIMFLLFSASIISGQTSNVKNNPVGKWKFEAPLAPEGYNLVQSILLLPRISIQRQYPLPAAIIKYREKTPGSKKTPLHLLYILKEIILQSA